jgi:P-type conjugative transfer protein TrbJ
MRENMQLSKLIKYLIGIIFISFVITFLLCLNAKAFIVYDPTNWIQNAATAANTAQQLEKQAQALEVALRDIKNYDGSVGQWANIQNLLQQLSNEVKKGQSLAYNMQNLDSLFQQKYPGYAATHDYKQSYSIWSQTALDTMRGTLESAGMQSRQFDSEQSALNQLSILSQSANGRMQALQVGNMIATQQVAQSQKLRQLVIAQINAQNTYASYQIQKDQSATASASAWIDAGDTSFPRYGSGQDQLQELPPIY